MTNNYLITGYWGEPHVTAENDRGINAATLGAGRFVLPVGEQFNAEYIGNNTIRMYDGKLMDNGAAAGIPAGEYIDLLIAEAGQGKRRNDLIVFQYSQDASTLVESGVFVVIKGTETSGTPADPDLTQENLLSGKATFDQMALWRVSVSGTIISAPVKLFTVSASVQDALDAADGAKSAAEKATSAANDAKSAAEAAAEAVNDHNHSASDITSGTLPIARGGTGAGNAATARSNLSVYSKDEVDGSLAKKAPAYTYGATDLEAGVSPLENGKLYFKYK